LAIWKEKRVDNEETRAGISEHVYNVLDYRRAFGQSGLEARFSLPGAVLAMLQEQRTPGGVGRLRERLLGLGRAMWGNSALRRVVRSRWANLLGLLFLEYGLTAVARKRAKVRAR
jgi:hypothetical protein